MPGFAAEIVIGAPARFVWDDIKELASHVEWMSDAVAISFLGPQTSGTGARFICKTRVGPFTFNDEMEVTEWKPAKVISIRHLGDIGGRGTFSLVAAGSNTIFGWSERLEFPSILGGDAGASIVVPILTRIWRRNLKTLKGRIERLYDIATPIAIDE